MSRSTRPVEAKVRAYLGWLAWALPGSLIFTAFRGFNTAVSRPKAVMVLQLGGLCLKLPLNALMIFGATWATPFGTVEIAPQGAAGCGIASVIALWAQTLAAAWLLRRDPFYAPFGLQRLTLDRPRAASLRQLLRLGIPMGLSIGIEVTGFTFMAFFISRIGPTPVAGHQIAVNLVSLMFMMPLSLGNATSTLVAQQVGAGEIRAAGRMGWHGLQLGVMVAAVLGGAVYLLRRPLLSVYTSDAAIIAAAMPLLAWVMLFHVTDAAQTIAAFILRAYRIATAPMVIYALAIWGVGIGGGYLLAFDPLGVSPSHLQGAIGFWSASTVGLTVAATMLTAVLAWVLREKARSHPAV